MNITAGTLTVYMYSDVQVEVIDNNTGEVLYQGKNLDFSEAEQGYYDEVITIEPIYYPYHIRLMVNH